MAAAGVNRNNLLAGMFRTEGFDGNVGPYADALGLERVEDICLAHVMEHNKIPAGFLADADDLAPMAAMLCSELSRFIVGQNIVIDGGQHASIF